MAKDTAETLVADTGKTSKRVADDAISHGMRDEKVVWRTGLGSEIDGGDGRIYLLSGKIQSVVNSEVGRTVTVNLDKESRDFLRRHCPRKLQFVIDAYIKAKGENFANKDRVNQEQVVFARWGFVPGKSVGVPVSTLNFLSDDPKAKMGWQKNKAVDPHAKPRTALGHAFAVAAGMAVTATVTLIAWWQLKSQIKQARKRLPGSKTIGGALPVTRF